MTLSIAFDMLPAYEIKIENINDKRKEYSRDQKEKAGKKKPY